MRRNGQRGSQLVEAGFMLVPFLALAFLVLDEGWAIFVKATLQTAVREGTRYAVTGQSAGSIQTVVQQYALGLLSGSQESTLVINCWNPVNAQPNPADTTQCGVGGNIVEVSVEGYQISPLAPLLRSSIPVAVTVSAADLIEGTPNP
jgi:Flp pilus assembly protein TadG